ncbi:hypothetical protein [Solidesulfovibrio carbinoliphilus]|uniref:hypothetical protein n=1 Tax=Solidesulfovibrio carbinoliphilus TaxID=345370 RepID=UPI0012F4F98D|nr:hypothetical protein [Solidesulfovibrio carbinoliphilus]
MKIILTLLVVFLLAGSAWAQGNTNPSDMAEAKSFVASLPPACSSNIATRPDGTVAVSFVCVNKANEGKAGTVFIKNGKVTNVN